MSKNIRSTNLRFNLDKELQKKAWDFLQGMDKSVFKSYNHAIALSVVEYFERYYRNADDPYFETRQREEKFVAEIIEAVERAMEKSLPLFLAGLFAHTGQTVPVIPPEAKAPAPVCPDTNEADIDWDFIGE